MYVCVICHAPIEIDDVQVGSPRAARCVCVRCFRRETGAALRMPAGVRRDAEAAVHDWPEVGI